MTQPEHAWDTLPTRRPGDASTARLDRLVWVAGTAFRCYGQRVGIRVSERHLIPAVESILPPDHELLPTAGVQRLYSVLREGRGRRRGIRRYHLVYAQSERIARTRDLEEGMGALERDLQHHVAERSRRLVFVHAGVVAWRGRAIVIPGRSRSGKSTLVAALVAAGASYYSDEYALVDAAGRVHAFPAPLALREGDAGRRKRRGPRPRERPPPLVAALVLATRYQPGATWRHRSLSPGRAALEVLRHAVPARRDPARVLDRLARLVARSQVVTGVRGEAREAARRVLQLAEPGAPARAAAAPVTA